MTACAVFIREAAAKVAGSNYEVILDFAPLSRIDSDGLRALEDLAVAAEAKSVALRLRGVSPEVYRVLKQLKLERRFSYVDR
jgi:anti-anti-sigma factor